MAWNARQVAMGNGTEEEEKRVRDAKRAGLSTALVVIGTELWTKATPKIGKNRVKGANGGPEMPKDLQIWVKNNKEQLEKLDRYNTSQEEAARPLDVQQLDPAKQLEAALEAQLAIDKLVKDLKKNGGTRRTDESSPEAPSSLSQGSELGGPSRNKWTEKAIEDGRVTDDKGRKGSQEPPKPAKLVKKSQSHGAVGH